MQTKESAAQAWDVAYHWLCRRRQHVPPNADVRDLPFNWPHRKVQWFNRVLTG